MPLVMWQKKIIRNAASVPIINQKGIGQITLKFPKDKAELATFTPALLAKAFRGEL